MVNWCTGRTLLGFNTTAAVLAFMFGCSTSPTPSDEPHEPVSPIESEHEDVQRQFDRGVDYLEEQRWELAVDEFRLLQSEHAGDEVAELAELYIARGLLGDLDEQFVQFQNGEQPEQRVDREVFSLLEPLADSVRVDERIRRSAQAYLAASYALQGQPANAVEVFADYPDAQLAPKVLADDARWLWPLVAEGLHEASRYGESVFAWAEFHELLRQKARESVDDDSTADAPAGTDAFEFDPFAGAGQLAEEADLAVSRAFDAAGELDDNGVSRFVDAQLPLARAVGGWTMIRASIDEADTPLDDHTAGLLQDVFNDVSEDFLTIGAPERASELSVLLASVLQPERLVVGAALPLSGPDRTVGRRALAGMLVAQRAFHDAGHPAVTLAIEDSGDDVTAAYRRLVDQGAVAVVGPLATDEARQLIEPAAEHQVPVMALTPERLLADADVDVDEYGLETDELPTPPVFRNFVDAVEEARAAARISFDDLGDRRAAVVYPDIGYGEVLARAFTEEFRRQGGRIVAELEYDRESTNYADVAARVANAEPEAIFLPDTGAKASEVSAFFAQEQIWGVQPGASRPSDGRTHVHYFGTSLWQSPIVVEQAGSYLEGALVPAWHSPQFDDPITRQFVHSFEAIYDSHPDHFVAFAYDSVNQLRSLLVDRGVVDALEVDDALRQGGWNRGATGRHHFDEHGEPRRELRFLTVGNGQWNADDRTVVTPLEGREDLEETLEDEGLDTDEEAVDEPRTDDDLRR